MDYAAFFDHNLMMNMMIDYDYVVDFDDVPIPMMNLIGSYSVYYYLYYSNDCVVVAVVHCDYLLNDFSYYAVVFAVYGDCPIQTMMMKPKCRYYQCQY